MQEKYCGLNELLQDNEEARSYFHALPDYVQDTMLERPDGINSFESMRHYADNLTRGDH